MLNFLIHVSFFVCLFVFCCCLFVFLEWGAGVRFDVLHPSQQLWSCSVRRSIKNSPNYTFFLGKFD